MREPVLIDVPLSELVARARNTLRAERAKPRDIALAWARLCAFEQGEDFGGNEKSYRRIYDAHQWILAQGFALSDSAGMPAGPIKGVTVKPPGYDVEDRMMVRVADVRAKAKEQGRPWPIDAVAEHRSEVSEEQPNGMATAEILALGWVLDGYTTDQLKRAMSNPRDAKWLRVACVQPGKKEGGVPALWNPVGVAAALISRGYLKQHQANKLFRNELPDYETEWERYWEDRESFSS